MDRAMLRHLLYLQDIPRYNQNRPVSKLVSMRANVNPLLGAQRDLRGFCSFEHKRDSHAEPSVALATGLRSRSPHEV